MVKLLDLQKITAMHRDEYDMAIRSVLDAGWFLQGHANQQFESDYAQYVGTKHCVAVANGLDALKLIIRGYKELGVFHDGDEIMRALTVGAEIIGVNNRNLTDFTVDIDNSINLRRCVSDNIIFISESGIKTKEDVTKLKENNVDAVLIGETLMKSDDKKSLISELKNG